MMGINKTKNHLRLKQGFKSFVWLTVMFQIFVVLLSGVVAADDPLFITVVGGTDGDSGRSVAQTSDGGYIVGGSTYYGSGSKDFLLVKFDSSGVEQWSKAVGSVNLEEGYSVIQTSDGGYVIVGNMLDLSVSNYYVLFIKFDSSGTKQWAKTIGGEYANLGYSVAQTSDSGYIVTGYTIRYGGLIRDVLLIKLSSSGTKQWVKTIGDSDDDEGFSVVQTSDGGYVVAGQTSSYSVGADDFLLVKFDSSGNEQWTKTVGGASDDRAFSVAQTSDEGYVVTGFTRNYDAEGTDILLVKFDSSGNEQWTKTVGGANDDFSRSVAQTSDGGYIVTGYTKSYGGTDYDVLLVKFDSSGVVEWAKTVGNASSDNGFSVAQTSDGGYVVGGGSNSYGGADSDVLLIHVDANGECGECSALASEDLTAVSHTVTAVSHTVTAVSHTVTVGSVSVSEVSYNPDSIMVCPESTSTLPTFSTFTSEETTNFSGETNLTNVKNLTLATNHAKIQFPVDYGINTDGEDYDTNIIFGDCFVSVNTAPLDSTFNSTAYLTFNNSDGHCGNNIIYEMGGFPTSANEIRTNNKQCEKCSDFQQTNNFVTQFKVDHFTGYAIGSNTRLTIYDSYGEGNAPVNENIVFYASYTDIAGSAVTGATCDIDFDSAGSPSAMSYVGQRYEYTRSFTATGIHNFTINCAKSGLNTLSANDTVGLSEVPSQIVTDSDSWDQTIGDSTHHIADLIYHSTGTFVAGTIFYNSQYDFFLKKLNSSGSLIWNRTFDYSNLDLARALDLDSNNNIIITGDCNNSHISICTVKYDNDGNLLWNQTLNLGDDTYVLGIETDSSDNIYLSGYYYNSTSGSYDSLLVKYNSAGNLEYSTLYDGGGDERAGDVVVASDGTIYMAVTEGLGSSQDMCLYLMNEFGFLMHKHCFDSGDADIADSIVVDGDAVYVSGQSGEEFQINKYDENVSLIWNQTFNPGEETLQVGKVTVVLDPTPASDDVYIAGSSYVQDSTYQSTYVKYSPTGTVRYSASSPIQSDSTVVPTIGQSTYYEGGNFAVVAQSAGEPPRIIASSAEVISNSVERPLPKISDFVPSVDFLELPDLNSVENLTLDGGDGAINFVNNITVKNQNFEVNIIIGECFISVNTTGLDPSMNAPSILGINDTGNCNGTTIFRVPGFHTTLNSAKLAAGGQICADCTGKQRIGNRISFDVPHFTTYYLGSYADLVIYDNYEDSYVPADTDIIFYANYTNSTSGEHIGGADCIIEFDDNPGTTFAMTDNGVNYNFTKSDGFATEALHIWNVTCSNATGVWDTLNLSDDIQVGVSVVIPEFSLVTLGFGLIAILIGLFIIRRKT